MWTCKIIVGQWHEGGGDLDLLKCTFPLQKMGLSFVYAHTHTHTYTTHTRMHGTFSQNPAKSFPFSVEKNQLCLVVSFQKPLLMV